MEPEENPVAAARNARSNFLDWAITEAEKVGSVVEEYEEFEWNDLMHVRIINTLLACKSRFYVRLVLLRLPETEYKASKFLTFLPKEHFSFDENQLIGAQIVFYKYAQLEGHTIFTMKGARKAMPTYNDKIIMASLLELCPVFCQLVKFKYVDYRYELLKYPEASIPHYDIVGKAVSENVPPEDVRLLQENYIDKPVNYEDFNQPSDGKKKVEDAIFVTKRTRFSFHGITFCIDRSLLYWVLETQESKGFGAALVSKLLSPLLSNARSGKAFEDGKKFQALVLESGHQLVFLKNSQLQLKDMLALVFKRRLAPSRGLFNNTPSTELPYLMKHRIFENSPAAWNTAIKPGYILYTKQAPHASNASIHFGVYLGNRKVLHTNFDLSVTDDFSQNGSYYRKQGIEAFLEMKTTTLVNALIPVYMPFPVEDILAQAETMSKVKLANSELNKDHENMAFEFMFGKRFSYENTEGSVFTAAELEKLVNAIKQLA